MATGVSAGTIPRLLQAAVEAAHDDLWLLAPGERYTYGEALTEIERMAAGLRASGVARGDRVLVTARNSPRYLFAWLALMEIGAIEVPVNPAGTPAELLGLAQQVEPRLVLTDDDLAPVFGRAFRCVDVHKLRDTSPEGHVPDAAIEETDVAVMIPTSGTTGRSKLVMQTHRAYAWAGEGFPFWMQLTRDDRLMAVLPLFHINAPAYSVLGSVAARASLVLLPRFSASTFLETAREYEATEFNAIGAMLEILMRLPARPDDADNPIRRCYTGPSPTRERQLEIEQRFGFEIVCGYGMSESPYGLTWTRGTRPYGTLGSPRQHPTLGHVNDARVMRDGREVAAGEVGELELHNPVIMRGYYDMPEETAAVLVDGWLRTGDLVTDNGDGTYTFVGREKDVIRRRGENLSPAEVEAALELHPDVAEAAVIAVPAEMSEDDVKAFVLPAPGRVIDIVALHAFAGERLARFKVPRWFEVVDALPHTPTGRLAKHQLPRERNDNEVDMEQTRD